jgi:hypothetical protein
VEPPWNPHRTKEERKQERKEGTRQERKEERGNKDRKSPREGATGQMNTFSSEDILCPKEPSTSSLFGGGAKVGAKVGAKKRP